MFDLQKLQRCVLVAGSLALTTGACLQAPADSAEAAPSPARRATFARGADLAEDEEVAAQLRGSLDGLLEPLGRGEWSEAHTDSARRERFAFFYKSLLRGARDAEPIVLKSYPLEAGVYMVTLAFVTGAPGDSRISRIVELEAVPREQGASGFAFRSPYQRRTAHLQERTIGDVTFRFNGTFDANRAARFAQFKTKLDALQEREPEPLQYDCFPSLDGLLKAFGLVYDASKCNFLLHDLGFLWHDGQRFSTGTADEAYIFGYVRGVLPARVTDPEAIFWPYVNGAAAYYGGYGLSGDSMEVLARQFREELERRPAIDFLEEFEKGRASSVQRHFSNFVMCAFLYQEVAARLGERAALALVESGPDTEHFLEALEASIGVTRENFHATIKRLIGA